MTASGSRQSTTRLPKARLPTAALTVARLRSARARRRGAPANRSKGQPQSGFRRRRRPCASRRDKCSRFRRGIGFRASGREFTALGRGEIELVAAERAVVGESARDERAGMAPRVVLEEALVQPRRAVGRVEAGVRRPDDDEDGFSQAPVEIGLSGHVVEVAGGGEAGKEDRGPPARSWARHGGRTDVEIGSASRISSGRLSPRQYGVHHGRRATRRKPHGRRRRGPPRPGATEGACRRSRVESPFLAWDDPQIMGGAMRIANPLGGFAILPSGALPEKVRDGARSPLSLGG
jgi:hypothetical protein